MKKYVEKLEIKNEREIKQEILNWKNSVLMGVDHKRSDKLIKKIKILNYFKYILIFINISLFIFPMIV
jgi:hypothetical protein